MRGLRRRSLDLLHAAMAAAVAAALAVGCAPAARAREASATERALAYDRNATASKAGLECVRWYPAEDPATRRDGLAKIRDALGARNAEGLASHGVTALIVPQASLGDALAALGGSPVVRRTSLGQTTNWTPVSTVAIARGRIVFVGGRPQESDERVVHLGVRGWCFPTVEGAAARVEVRLAEDPPRLAAVTLDPARPRDRTRELPEGRLLVELAPDEALLVLETPVVPPKAEQTEGPEIVAPPSIGALLFGGDPFPDRRSAIVIVGTFTDMLPASGSAPSKPAPRTGGQGAP